MIHKPDLAKPAVRKDFDQLEMLLVHFEDRRLVLLEPVDASFDFCKRNRSLDEFIVFATEQFMPLQLFHRLVGIFLSEAKTLQRIDFGELIDEVRCIFVNIRRHLVHAVVESIENSKRIRPVLVQILTDEKLKRHNAECPQVCIRARLVISIHFWRHMRLVTAPRASAFRVVVIVLGVHIIVQEMRKHIFLLIGAFIVLFLALALLLTVLRVVLVLKGRPIRLVVFLDEAEVANLQQVIFFDIFGINSKQNLLGF